ncbi:MAG TPA: hypothetical protein VFS97_15100 [Nitrososphaeraceae archaeon]|nr:hypothetical protein [Nitrososphaeraceae archaeon]
MVGKRTIAKASCAPEESLVGGGFYVTGSDDAAYSHKESFFSIDTKHGLSHMI